MARKEYMVIDILDILRRAQSGDTIRSMARATGMGRNTVKKYLRLACKGKPAGTLLLFATCQALSSRKETGPTLSGNPKSFGTPSRRSRHGDRGDVLDMLSRACGDVKGLPKRLPGNVKGLKERR